jgi:hypothetical protein
MGMPDGQQYIALQSASLRQQDPSYRINGRCCGYWFETGNTNPDCKAETSIIQSNI